MQCSFFLKVRVYATSRQAVTSMSCWCEANASVGRQTVLYPSCCSPSEVPTLAIAWRAPWFPLNTCLRTFLMALSCLKFWLCTAYSCLCTSLIPRSLHILLSLQISKRYAPSVSGVDTPASVWLAILLIQSLHVPRCIGC